LVFLTSSLSSTLSTHRTLPHIPTHPIPFIPVILHTTPPHFTPSLTPPPPHPNHTHLPHSTPHPISGALCVGLNRVAAARASMAFAERKTKKQYLAVLRGHLDISQWPYRTELSSERTEHETQRDENVINNENENKIENKNKKIGNGNENENGKVISTGDHGPLNEISDDSSSKNEETTAKHGAPNHMSDVEIVNMLDDGRDASNTDKMREGNNKKRRNNNATNNNVDCLSWQRESMLSNLKIHFKAFKELFERETKKEEEKDKEDRGARIGGEGDGGGGEEGKHGKEGEENNREMRVTNDGCIDGEGRQKEEGEVGCLEINMSGEEENETDATVNEFTGDIEDRKNKKTSKYQKVKNKKSSRSSNMTDKDRNNKIPHHYVAPPLFQQLLSLNKFSFSDFEKGPKIRKLLRKALKVIFVEKNLFFLPLT
jgi:hypothetical protein